MPRRLCSGGWELWKETAGGSTVVLGLRKADRGCALFPFTAFLEEFDTLKTFEDGAFAADGGV